MIRLATAPGLKLAAIDLDGTLLGPAGRISLENQRAVSRLQAAGMEVVLASGRHYLSMHHYATSLPGIRWVISCQGGELSNVDRSTILATEFLPSATVTQAYAQGQALGFTVVVYGVDGVYTDAAWDSHLEFYAELSGTRPVRCQTAHLFQQPIFKLIWMGHAADIDRTVRQNLVNPAVIQMVRTHAQFLEFMPVSVSKASALQRLAERLGVKASEAVVFGDGDNDVPMFEWAGVSVAMAHGWPAALQKANYTTPEGPAESALARGIDWVLGNHPPARERNGIVFA